MVFMLWLSMGYNQRRTSLMMIFATFSCRCGSWGELGYCSVVNCVGYCSVFVAMIHELGYPSLWVWGELGYCFVGIECYSLGVW